MYSVQSKLTVKMTETMFKAINNRSILYFFCSIIFFGFNHLNFYQIWKLFCRQPDAMRQVFLMLSIVLDIFNICCCVCV